MNATARPDNFILVHNSTIDIFHELYYITSKWLFVPHTGSWNELRASLTAHLFMRIKKVSASHNKEISIVNPLYE